MKPISYARATDIASAVATVSADPTRAFLAGGTTEIDLLRQGVVTPSGLVDINELPLKQIESLPDGGLRIGALARMSEVAEASDVVERFPVIAQALVFGASAQLRHMASMGGNLLQRVRCSYFRDVSSPCNKREPGSGCAALDGINRGHAILGTSDQCIATHPSDVAVALVALDALVHVTGPNGKRTIPIDDFFLLPGATPHREHPLSHGELIVAIEVPALPLARQSLYLKIRDRSSYEFALVSVAVALQLDGNVIRDVHLALGGIATKPWRARRAEHILLGAEAQRANFLRAAHEELIGAAPRKYNTFKVELAERTIVRALEMITTMGGRA
ncbi:carbon-monoxide dehydrogenase medium subunit [Reticulibacter mediterranei]|uniref:Carbon-monoxide dehydrogenase medium subunit n=1 Tax=Reticulibacter mediterranei TaxID=2778369 RepID=A0A8J3IRG4_9CHLR|nr:xanthine dehydrogenase family protein subunit M [Reticulibacter mediterranei]GHO94876.1 carbon-monoxide dehydrogenase medium subunit [Reticulibacter mediterranei]